MQGITLSHPLTQMVLTLAEPQSGERVSIFKRKAPLLLAVAARPIGQHKIGRREARKDASSTPRILAQTATNLNELNRNSPRRVL